MKREELLTFALPLIFTLSSSTSVVVVCDLTDPFGKAVATWCENFDPQGPYDVWVFSMPEGEWQRRRKKLVGREDQFPSNMTKAVVISGKYPLNTGVIKVRDSAEAPRATGSNGYGLNLN